MHVGFHHVSFFFVRKVSYSEIIKPSLCSTLAVKQGKWFAYLANLGFDYLCNADTPVWRCARRWLAERLNAATWCVTSWWTPGRESALIVRSGKSLSWCWLIIRDLCDPLLPFHGTQKQDVGDGSMWSGWIPPLHECPLCYQRWARVITSLSFGPSATKSHIS